MVFIGLPKDYVEPIMQSGVSRMDDQLSFMSSPFINNNCFTQRPRYNEGYSPPQLAQLGPDLI